MEWSGNWDAFVTVPLLTRDSSFVELSIPAFSVSFSLLD